MKHTVTAIPDDYILTNKIPNQKKNDNLDDDNLNDSTMLQQSQMKNQDGNQDDNLDEKTKVSKFPDYN
jgi:hypothetical protein